MKKITKNVIIILIVIINLILVSNCVFASFADFDDATADAQGKNDLIEQQQEDNKNAGKSSNNYLQSLSIDGYEIIPTFDKQTINYNIEDEIETNTIIINAISEDERATIAGTGEIELQSGENNLRINVVAENGVSRTYFIKVIKKAEEQSQEIEDSQNNEELENIENTINTNSNEVNSSNKNIISILIIVVILVMLFVLRKPKKKRNSKH